MHLNNVISNQMQIKYHLCRSLSKSIRIMILLISITGTIVKVQAQEKDQTKETFHFNGSVNFTNNGMSFIPAFSLGKPATIFDLSIGKRLSFDPQFRFSMKERPWSFLFWWRYHLVRSKKFIMNVGMHPSFAFKTLNYEVNGIPKQTQVYDRYLAGELTPTFVINKHFSIGSYILFSKGLDPGAIKYTEFLTINSNISNIKLIGDIHYSMSPQFYFLNMGGKKGYYFSSMFLLNHTKYPISIGSLVNKSISTAIASKKSLVWNIQLIYSFHKNFIEKK